MYQLLGNLRGFKRKIRGIIAIMRPAAIKNGAPGIYKPLLFTKPSNKLVNRRGANTAATDANDAITPCTKPCLSSSTLFAATAVNKGGAISERAAMGITMATTQAAVENPKPISAIMAAMLEKMRVR